MPTHLEIMALAGCQGQKNHTRSMMEGNRADWNGTAVPLRTAQIGLAAVPVCRQIDLANVHLQGLADLAIARAFRNCCEHCTDGRDVFLRAQDFAVPADRTAHGLKTEYLRRSQRKRPRPPERQPALHSCRQSFSPRASENCWRRFRNCDASRHLSPTRATECGPRQKSARPSSDIFARSRPAFPIR